MVTKWSTLLEVLNVSEQTPEQGSGEPGSLSAGPAAPAAPNASAPLATSESSSTTDATGGDALKLMSEQSGAEGTVKDASEETSEEAAKENFKIDPPKPELPKADPSRTEAPKVSMADAPKSDAPKVDAIKAKAPRLPGTVTIMAGGERAGATPEAAQDASMFGKRRLAAMAAVVALAVVAGALGGALATAGIGHFVADDATANHALEATNHALEANIDRLDNEVQALKASAEQTVKANTTLFNKTGERLDKVEKAQAEPSAKLARLSEAVDKLRAAPAAASAAAATPVAAKEVTGSISPPASAAPAAAAKPEVARLPTVEGWVLRDVTNGAALIESRRGMFEVYAGDPIPGLGRVDAIRRQDGRWVVVTGKGLIVAR
jgi:hypothetical protein